MDETKNLWVRAGALVAVLLMLLVLALPTTWQEQIASAFTTLGFGSSLASGGGLLTVAFLDVGQGDSIYIETPDGVQVLIDGGPDRKVLTELAKVMPLFDRSLDVIIATHSDKDHIGGLLDVLSRYTVLNIVRTENKNDTSVTDIFLALAEVEEGKLHIARAGQQLELGASTTLAILSPLGDPREWESNASSIVAQLQYGETAFMLTGDAPVGIEDYLVDSYGSLLVSDVLKLGHHGSKTSSGEKFLEMVLPAYGIVSAGKDNRYGHPHLEVLERVAAAGVEVLNTATAGTLIFKSDGKSVWVE